MKTENKPFLRAGEGPCNTEMWEEYYHDQQMLADEAASAMRQLPLVSTAPKPAQKIPIGGWHLCDKCRAIVNNGNACARCAEAKPPTPPIGATDTPRTDEAYWRGGSESVLQEARAMERELTAAANANKKMKPRKCQCRSYNRPDWGGETPEVVLPKPEWSSRENGICVDACIADAITMLWSNGIVTEGCCCGHNRMPPSVVLDSAADGKRAVELLRDNDGRQWDVMQWRLITINPKP